MSGIKVVVLTLIVASLAIASGQDILFHLTYVLLVTVAVSRIWSWISLRGLSLDRTLRQDRTSAGGTIEQRLVMTSTWRVPRLWLEVVDTGTIPGYHVGRVIDFGFGGQRVWKSEVYCPRRGLYELGPALVATNDPFGLFHVQHKLGPTRTVLVYPRTVDLTGLALPAGHQFGGDRPVAGWHQTTPHVAGVRDYRPGDPLKQIHWLSTARTGRMMVKEFDIEPSSDVWIFLDLDEAAHHGEGDESTVEYAVSIAASVAKHYVEMGRTVGLVARGAEHVVLTADRGQRQLIKILEELAIVQADGAQPIAELIGAEGERCTRNASVLVITASLDERWPATLRAMRDRGIRAAAIVLEPATFDEDAANSLLLVGELAAADVSNILVKRGDDLGRVLSAGWKTK